jgi:hypothetical protein
MPREFFSTNAPLSAASSAALRARTDEDHSIALIRSEGANQVKPRFRVVAGGAPAIEPVVEDGGYPAAVLASDSDGEDVAEDWLDPLEARLEARMDDGGSRAPFMATAETGDGELKIRNPQNAEDAEMAEHAENQSAIRNPQSAIRSRTGLKKLNKKQIALDLPPTPRGCEWRRSDDGLNLWRCWTEWDDNKTKRIKKSRYAGHLSDDAWRIMKEYNHEAIISTIGERLRRHSGR